MPISNLTLVTQPSKQNLQRLCVMRGILALVLLTLAALITFQTDVELPWFPLMWVIGGMLAFNSLVLLRLRQPWRVRQIEVLFNLLADVLLLTVILYFTGGSTNPLVSYFLIPLIISAAVLRPVFTWLLVAVTISLYTMLFFWFRPLGLFEGAGHHGANSAHFVGMWINFGVSALLIAWFVVRMAQSLRDNEKANAEFRERGMRDEQIIRVASIAAGTAHELRTPLATMAVLVGELEDDHPQTHETAEELHQQIERCDAILRSLVSTTTESGQLRQVSVASVYAQVLEKWSLARPEVQLKKSMTDAAGNFEIRCDQSLVHAFLSFLNNAADACPEDVRFRVDSDDSRSIVRFTIEDRGAGIPPELTGHLGRVSVSRKTGGLGLGVLLSQASIERLGGQVELFSDPGSGTRLEISLPVVNTFIHE